MLNPFSQKRDLARKFVPKPKLIDEKSHVDTENVKLVASAQIEPEVVSARSNLVRVTEPVISTILSENNEKVTVVISKETKVAQNTLVSDGANLNVPTNDAIKAAKPTYAIKLSKKVEVTSIQKQSLGISSVPYAKSILPSELYGENCPYELHTVYLKKSNEVSILLDMEDYSFIGYMYIIGIRIEIEEY